MDTCILPIEEINLGIEEQHTSASSALESAMSMVIMSNFTGPINLRLVFDGYGPVLWYPSAPLREQKTPPTHKEIWEFIHNGTTHKSADKFDYDKVKEFSLFIEPATAFYQQVSRKLITVGNAKFFKNLGNFKNREEVFWAMGKHCSHYDYSPEQIEKLIIYLFT